MKKPRPSTVEKILANQAAAPPPPSLTIEHVHNLVFAARRALATLGARDLQIVSTAIAHGETVLEHHRQTQAFAKAQSATAPPPADPLPATPADKKG